MATNPVPPAPHPEKPDSAYWHKSSEFYSYTFPFPGGNPLATADQITARRAYLACVRYTDRQVGKVLDALDSLGLTDSTIVVLWGDHGWQLGDSQIWGKHALFERTLHSPLIIRAPGIAKPGVRCEALAETLDIYPTLVDLCRPGFAQTQHPLDGLSLRPLLEGTESSVRNTATSYWQKGVTIRTPSHRLIYSRSPDGSITDKEFYDLRITPDPVENVAERHPDIVGELLGR
jgi:iduronate 2-sulfatase